MSVTFNSIRKKPQKYHRKLIKGLDRFSTKIFWMVCNFMKKKKHFQKKKGGVILRKKPTLTSSAYCQHKLDLTIVLRRQKLLYPFPCEGSGRQSNFLKNTSDSCWMRQQLHPSGSELAPWNNMPTVLPFILPSLPKHLKELSIPSRQFWQQLVLLKHILTVLNWTECNAGKL